jgi:Tfp pilus assembly protein PilF
MIEDMLQKKPRSPSLYRSLAALRNLQEQYFEAQQLYRDALKIDAKDVLAMNNLAWLVSLNDGKGKEALQLLQEAENVAGPLPDLLDTRAVTYLIQGDSARAITLLEDVIAVSPTATDYFHLARAHAMARDRLAAATALKKAQELGLQSRILHPLERQVFRQLHADLGIELPSAKGPGS